MVGGIVALSGLGIIISAIVSETVDLDADGFGPDVFIMAVVVLWRIKMLWVNMCQTYFVLRKFRLIGRDADVDHSWLMNDENKGPQMLRRTTLEHMHSLDVQKRNALLNMKDVLVDMDVFDLFARHCGNEYCLECVLSVIEFVQFKQKIYENLDEEQKEKCNTENMEKMDILPQSCPQSDIVFGRNGDNFKLISRDLFVKYIEIGSEWEINISYSARNKYIHLMDDEDIWLNEMNEYNDLMILYELFDECIMEMISLMKSAFSRFKQEDKFLLLQSKSDLKPRSHTVAVSASSELEIIHP